MPAAHKVVSRDVDVGDYKNYMSVTPEFVKLCNKLKVNIQDLHFCGKHYCYI